MMKFIIFAVINLIFISSSTGNNVENLTTNKCKQFERQFTHGLQLYYECITESTKEDFWFCKNCSGEYWLMYSAYEYLKISYDSNPAHNNMSCISELVDKDRMNIWQRIHTEAVKLWDDANCLKCYDWNETLVHNNTPVVQKWSEEFSTFLILTQDLKMCEVKNEKSPCVHCEKNYTDLNKFYETLKKKYQTNICFDIENSMNGTRRYWSGNLGCCRDDEASFLVFSIMASIIGALPIIFYFSAYFITKRAEDQTPLTDGETPITPNASSINTEYEPVASSSSTSGISNASTAIVKDSSSKNLNNTLAESALKKTNIKDITKKSNIPVNPNNIVIQNNLSDNNEQPERDPSQNLINLEQVASGTSAELINL